MQYNNSKQSQMAHCCCVQVLAMHAICGSISTMMEHNNSEQLHDGTLLLCAGAGYARHLWLDQHMMQYNNSEQPHDGTLLLCTGAGHARHLWLHQHNDGAQGSRRLRPLPPQAGRE